MPCCRVKPEGEDVSGAAATNTDVGRELHRGRAAHFEQDRFERLAGENELTTLLARRRPVVVASRRLSTDRPVRFDTYRQTAIDTAERINQ